jgi:myosin heavy subunit
MSLSFLKINEAQQQSIWKLLVAILTLGNIKFSPSGKGDASKIDSAQGDTLLPRAFSFSF